jgi:uncharacterized protein
MGSTNTIAIDLRPVAQTLQLSLRQIETVVELLDAGNTVPFITRYRKDQTGGLDEEQIRQIESRLIKMRLLAERKQTILRSIESQGKLTDALAAEIEAAHSTKRLEDLYLPFKPKKQTLATVARERGLDPLAEEVLAGSPSCANLDERAADFINTDRGVNSAADALLGVGHILAEGISERAELRHKLRQILNRTGKLTSARAEADEKLAQGFRDYFEFQEPLEKVPQHRVLAINRGERAKVLRVRIDADLEAMQAVVDESVCVADHPHADFIRGCGRDALQRLIFPSLEREVRRELTDWAEAHAVEVFARNLRNLLLQKPVRGRRVLAIDPGFKSGCKLAALDEFGGMIDQAVIHLVGKPERKAEGRAKLVDMIKTHQLTLAAIGNGTACRNRRADDRNTGHRAGRSGRVLRHRERGRRERLFHQPLGARGISRLRRHAARSDLDRPPHSRSAQRTGEDRPRQHRRRHVSARCQGQALARLARCGSRVVRQLRGR